MIVDLLQRYEITGGEPQTVRLQDLEFQVRRDYTGDEVVQILKIAQQTEVLINDEARYLTDCITPLLVEGQKGKAKKIVALIMALPSDLHLDVTRQIYKAAGVVGEDDRFLSHLS